MDKKIAVIILFLSFLLITSPVFAVTIKNPLAAGGVNDIPTLFKKIITGLGELIIFLGGIMIVVAGFLFMTSAGSPEKINTAKKALTYAIIGIIVGLTATGIAETIKSIL